MGQIVIATLLPEEWQKYKEIRLEALKNDPTAFSATYEEKILNPDQKWIDGLKDAEKRECDILLFAKDGEKVIGMIGAYWNNQPTTGHTANIWGVYVNRNYRGQGIGKKLMDVIVDEIKKHPQIIKISLGVNTKNEPALELYKSCDFKIVGTLQKELKFGDNFVDEYLMELLMN